MNQSVQWWLQQVGAPYNVSDPFAAIYPQITARNKPSGLPSPDFDNEAEACLRFRGLIYWKQTPGDCGSWTSRTSAIPTNASTTSQADVENISDAAISHIPVIGGIIAAIFGGIFQEHEQAVQAEQTNICNVSLSANASIYSIDAAVAAGTITAAEGISAMQQVATQLIAQLQQTVKTPTDASVYYQGFLRAHVDFANTYYAALAPAGISKISSSLASLKTSLLAGGATTWIVLLAIAVVIFLMVKR